MPLPEEVPQEIQPEESRQMTIQGFRRVSTTSTYCFVMGCSEREELHRINILIRTDILAKQSIYFPSGARVCTEHQQSGVWQDINAYSRPMHETFNREQLKDMLRLLQKKNASI